MKKEKGKKVMPKKFEWKAEVKFKGTVDEFNDIMSYLDKQPVEIDLVEWAGIRRHLAGCNRIPIENILDKVMIEKITAKSAKLDLKYIQDIAGGIRDPHIHVGDRVCLLSKDNFKHYAAEVAKELALMRVNNSEDYIEMMNPINSLGEYQNEPER